MSIEFDRSYIDEVLMLSGLALFLILAAVMPCVYRKPYPY